MPRRKYQRQLAELREDILALGDVATDRLQTALEALELRDEALAQSVSKTDRNVNQRYMDIEGTCIDLFALQQPVAGDLRFIAASFKISTDLIRIADLASNLAEYSIKATRKGFPAANLREIGTVAVEMVKNALEAYATEDTWGCHEVVASDDELDALCKRAGEALIHNLVKTELRNQVATESLVHNVFWLALVIRDLERIGDHAANIAARTLYMNENDIELIK